MMLRKTDSIAFQDTNAVAACGVESGSLSVKGIIMNWVRGLIRSRYVGLVRSGVRINIGVRTDPPHQMDETRRTAFHRWPTGCGHGSCPCGASRKRTVSPE